MKKLIAIISILLFIPSTIFANTMFNVLAGVVGSYDSGNDYVPATVDIREGGDGVGSAYVIAIYTHTGNYTGDYVSSSTSSTFSRHGTMGTQSGTFTNCSALTAGSGYHVVVLANGGMYFGVSGSTYATGKGSMTYPTFDAALNGSNVPSARFEFVIKNASGQTLLSYGDMTTTSTASLDNGQPWYNAGAVTCATL